jgi:UDP-N-acetylglucosamine 2-epimerase (non-hydrolysing)
MKVLIIMGTRPEAIKFAPLIREIRKDDFFELLVCATGQHREMLNQVLDFFEIKPDVDLNLMRDDQTVTDIIGGILTGLNSVFDRYLPDIVFVQGDTSTAFAGALAAFYRKIKVAHLEAGLRSGNLRSPFPEEANRKLISVIADYHFAPTPFSAKALNSEGYNNNIWIVGNTVIDALHAGLKIIELCKYDFAQEFKQVDFSKRIILLTAHRRESFGEPLERICEAILEIKRDFDDVEIVYPVHLNPTVRGIVFKLLSKKNGIHLINPLDYSRLIWLMKKSYLIMTDSGGIQEEGPSLGKPILVMREVTERVEGIEAGTAVLVGTSKEKIQQCLKDLLTDKNGSYSKMAQAANPYGDGTASRKILEILKGLN